MTLSVSFVSKMQETRLDPLFLIRPLFLILLATQVGMTNKWLKNQGLVSIKEMWVNIHYSRYLGTR